MRRLVSSAFAVFVGVLALAVTPQGQEPQSGGGRAAVALPDGPGKDAVTATCGACHGLGMITGATGYSQAAWRDLVATMVKLPAERETAITQYLASHFPPKPGRAPELVAGDVSVTFREWQVPTLGQRSRDPLQRPDGTIWWNGQFISLIGRLNPATGEMKEFPLDPASKPHSIVDDAEGNIWYLGNGNGTIGKFVPATGDDHRLPDARSRRPRSAHRHLRQERHAVLHAAAEQHARPPGAVHRRDQAGDAGDAARPALRTQAGLQGRRLGGLQRRRQDRPA